MTGIFCSYRRLNAGGHAGHLYSSLSELYRKDDLSMDLSIPPGADFVRWIEEKVGSCDVLLGILGPGWAFVKDEEGNVRLHDPQDFARIEIEAGLQRAVPIIPVLVGGAKMPNAKDLPASIAPLSRLHGLELSDDRWDYDVNRLFVAIEEQTGGRIPKLEPEVEVRRRRFEPARPEPDLPPVSSPTRSKRKVIHVDPEGPPGPTVIDVDEPASAAGGIKVKQPPPTPGQRTDNSGASPVAPERDRAKPFVTWGWILGTIGAVLLPPLALVSIVFAALVIARSDGRRTGTGVAIIIVSILAAAFGVGLSQGL